MTAMLFQSERRGGQAGRVVGVFQCFAHSPRVAGSLVDAHASFACHELVNEGREQG